MRWMKILFLLGLMAACSARAESAKIVKVLTHFLDEKGRHALSPSLYERDAYQSKLRRSPELRSAIRFDVHWKPSGLSELKVRVEARGMKQGQPQQIVLEKNAKKAGFPAESWCRIPLDGEAYKKFGELTAWRVTLWSGDRQIAEQKSFLW